MKKACLHIETDMLVDIGGPGITSLREDSFGDISIDRCLSCKQYILFVEGEAVRTLSPAECKDLLKPFRKLYKCREEVS